MESLHFDFFILAQFDYSNMAAYSHLVWGTDKSNLRLVDRVYSMWSNLQEMKLPEKVIKYVHSVLMSLRS